MKTRLWVGRARSGPLEAAVELVLLLDEGLPTGVRLGLERAQVPGGCTQRVMIRTRRGDLRLISVAAGARAVPNDAGSRAAFIRRLWEINAHTDLVAFGLDSRGRVTGTCTHPLDTLDCEEFEVYLLALVRECDRLEWVITGEDRW